jgi:hypothetical protein
VLNAFYCRNVVGRMGDWTVSLPTAKAAIRAVRGAAWACLAVLLLAFNAHAQRAATPDSGLATRHLFEAVLRNNMEAIKESLAKGADLNARNARGVTPAELAVELGYLDIANYLLTLDKTRKEKAEKPGSTPTPAAPDAVTKEKDKKPAKRAPKKTDESLFAPAPPAPAKPLSARKEPTPVKPRPSAAPMVQAEAPTASDPAPPSDPFARYFRPLTRPEEASAQPTTAGPSPPAPALVPAPVPLTGIMPAPATSESAPPPAAAETAATEPPPPAPSESPLPIIGKIRGPDDPAPAPEPIQTPTPSETAAAPAKPSSADEPDALARVMRAFASRLKSEEGRPSEPAQPAQIAPTEAPSPPPPPAPTPAPKTEAAPESPPAPPASGPTTRFLKRMTGLVESAEEKKGEPTPTPAKAELPSPPPAPAPTEAIATGAPEPALPAPVPKPETPPSALTPPPLEPAAPTMPAAPAMPRAEPEPTPPPTKRAETPPAAAPEPAVLPVRTALTAAPLPEESSGPFSRFFKRVTKMAGIDLDRLATKPPPKAAAPEVKPAPEPEPKPLPAETKTETPEEPATARPAATTETPTPTARPSEAPPPAGEPKRAKKEPALPPPQRPQDTRPKNFFQLLAEWMQRDRRDEAAKAPKPIPRELLAPSEEPSAPPTSPPTPSATDLAALQDKDSWAPKVERGTASPPATGEPSLPAPLPSDTVTAPVSPDAIGDTSTVLELPAVPPAGTAPDTAREGPGTQEATATLFGMPAPPATEAEKPAGEALTLFGLPVPGEKKARPETAPSGGLFGQPAAPAEEEAKKEWAVKSVETAQARPAITRAPEPEVAVPVSSNFVLGRSLVLGKQPPPRESEPLKDRSCIDKMHGAITFCLESANWPKSIEESFRVNTVLYTGFQAIVRYDGGVATRLQTMFPSEHFDKIVGYFTGLYGSPQEYWTRSIAPLASARQNNPTRAWRARHPTTGQVMVLEIRQYDDTRGGFPDTKRGVVMVYVADAKPIFPQVSSLELMRLKRLR